MKKQKKVLALVLCAVMLVASSVLATMAYLTSTTEVVTNTFTSAANVKITLDEADVDEYGVAIENAARVTGNDYKLVPGHTYVKDPTVHVDGKSEKCWLFVKVVDEIAAIEDVKTVETQMTEIGWTKVANGVYAYPTIVEPNADVKVFENFKLKGDADVAAYAGKTITVQAYGVQADGFATAADAWAAAPLAAWK